MKKNNKVVLELLWSNKPIPSVSLIHNFEIMAGVDNPVKWNSEDMEVEDFGLFGSNNGYDID